MKDDSKCMIEQFAHNYLEGNLIQKLQYFFSISNWPHPKISIRLLTIFDYYLTGEINFIHIKFFSLLSFLGFGSLFYLLGNAKDKLVLSFPSLCVVFIPNISNHWAVLTSVPLTAMLCMLSFYFIYKDKLLLSILFCFLISFNAFDGIIVFGLAICLNLLLNYKNLGERCLRIKLSLQLISFATVCFMLKVFVINVQRLDSRLDTNVASLSLGNFFEIFENFWSFSFMILRQTYNTGSFIFFIITFLLTVFASINVLKSFKEGDNNPLIFYFSFIYYLGFGLILSIYKFGENVDVFYLNYRFNINSFFTLSLLLYLLLYRTVCLKYLILKVIVISALMIPLHIKSHSHLSKVIYNGFVQKRAIGEMIKAKKAMRKTKKLRKQEIKYIEHYKIYSEYAIPYDLFTNEKLLEYIE